jgi:hypothetical protein
MPATNFSYPSSSAAVVFGGHLSAHAAFRLDKIARNRQLFIPPTLAVSIKDDTTNKNKKINNSATLPNNKDRKTLTKTIS